MAQDRKTKQPAGAESKPHINVKRIAYMGDDAEFDALYNELFGGDPAPVPKPKPARKLNALSTATCANCHGAMKMSMVGMIHVKSGNDLCYGPSRPTEVGIPVVDE